MTDRSLWTIAAFLVMWNFNPFASNVLQHHMTEHWKWSETFFGETMSWQAVGWIIGGLIHAPCSRYLSASGLFHISIATESVRCISGSRPAGTRGRLMGAWLSSAWRRRRSAGC